MPPKSYVTRYKMDSLSSNDGDANFKEPLVYKYRWNKNFRKMQAKNYYIVSTYLQIKTEFTNGSSCFQIENFNQNNNAYFNRFRYSDDFIQFAYFKG